MWKALAKLQLSSVDEIPVVFDNVQFIRNVPVPVDGKSFVTRHIFYNQSYNVLFQEKSFSSLTFWREPENSKSEKAIRL